MKSLDEVVLDPEFVGGTISHEQLKECNHKGQHLIEDCGLDLSAVVGGPDLEGDVRDCPDCYKDYICVDHRPLQPGEEPEKPEYGWLHTYCDVCEVGAGHPCHEECPVTHCDCPTHRGREEDTQTKSTNPKDILAQEESRVLLHLIPSPGLVHTALAMMDGARKYGPYNWREKGVGAGTYISAAQRHLRDWLDGEECAPDSGTHHLGHAAACLMILMDAQAVGNLVDDRPLPAPTAEMMEEVKRSGKIEAQREEGREEYGPGGCAV